MYRSFPVLNEEKTFESGLSFILPDVFVLYDVEPLYHKSLRIVVAPHGIAEAACGYERAFRDVAGADDALVAIGPHLVGVAVEVATDAVYPHRLQDVAGYQLIEVAFLLQVAVVADGAFVREIEGTLDVALDGVLIGSEGEEQLVKAFHVFAGLDGAVLLQILREGEHQRLAVVQYVDFLPLRLGELVCLSCGQQGDEGARREEDHPEQPKLPE